MEESKHEKFIRLAQKRTNAVLEALRILSNCSNLSSYEYTAEEVEKIFKEIESHTKAIRAQFSPGVRKEFKL